MCIYICKRFNWSYGGTNQEACYPLGYHRISFTIKQLIWTRSGCHNFLYKIGDDYLIITFRRLKVVWIMFFFQWREAVCIDIPYFQSSNEEIFLSQKNKIIGWDWVQFQSYCMRMTTFWPRRCRIWCLAKPKLDNSYIITFNTMLFVLVIA